MSLKLLSGVSAAAVACLVLGACNDERNSNSDPAHDSTVSQEIEEMAETVGETVEDAAEAIAEGAEDVVEAVETEIDQVIPSGMTARNMLGDPVYTFDDDAAAKLRDVFFSDQGRAQSALLMEGGLLGIGDDPVLIPFNRLVISEPEAGEVRIQVNLSESELEKLGDMNTLPADFSVYDNNASEFFGIRSLMGSEIKSSAGVKIAEVYDFLFGAGMGIEQVVIAYPRKNSLGDRLIALDWQLFEVTLDRKALRAKADLPDLDILPEFTYSEEKPVR